MDAAALLPLPYDTSLTEAGVAYAKKSLHFTYNRMQLVTAERLRKIVIGVAMETALERWLTAQAVPFDRQGRTNFTQADIYDLAIRGRRCDLKTFLIKDPRKLERIHHDPAQLMAASALVPEDQWHSDTLQASDLYMFGFLFGQDTVDAVEAAAAAPLYLLHPPADPAWRPRAPHPPLGRLALKCDTSAPVQLEVGGQDEQGREFVEHLLLQPRRRQETQAEFGSLLYLHPAQPPDGPVGVSSPRHQQLLIVPAEAWDNIWIYGQAIVLAGWLTKAEFTARSQALPAGTAVWQYPHTRTPNRAVSLTALRPLQELLEPTDPFPAADG